jgi:hypothetical protein
MIGRAVAAGGILIAIAYPLSGQQPDTSFRHAVQSPAYDRDAGPVVCIDESHANRHTISGTYIPFATLVRDDGYRVQGFSVPWSATALQGCAVLVVANAVAPVNARDRALPHPRAFSKPELDTLVAWLGAGGSLLLIADHAPWPGAVADLGLVLGVEMLDAFAAPGDSGAVIALFGTPAVSDSAWRQYASDRGLPFRLIAGAVTSPGTLGSHPILQGRTASERIRWVVTFTGHAFYPSSRIHPLLVFGPRAIASLDRPDAATFPIGGWLQAGALELGRGRAVVLGEASMCTAQVGGPRRIRTGINIPEAPDNAQFCLNVVRWLTKVLNDAGS